MNEYTTKSISAVILTIVMATFSYAQDADSFAKRFVDELYRNTPVAGVFQIDETVFEAGKPPRIKESIPRDNVIRKPVPDNVTLKLRWAISSDRELLETLPGTIGSEHCFYYEKGKLLEGASIRSMNITDKNPMPVLCPSSFTFRHGGGRNWKELLAKPDIPCSLRSEGVHHELTVKSSNSIVYRLNISKDDLSLQNAVGLLNEEEIWRLVIHQYIVRGDNRFPASASIEIRKPKTGEIMRKRELKTLRVDFPKSKDAIDKAFELIVPKGTLVADRVLGGVAETDRTFTAVDILSKPGSLKLGAFSQSVPSVSSNAVDPDEERPAEFEYWKWVSIGFAIIVLITIVSYLFGRKSRLGNTSTPPIEDN